MNPAESFLSLLVSPATGEKLYYNDADQTLTTANKKESFQIMDGIPLLAEPIKDAGSFDYKTHYEKDAVAFSYDDSFDNSLEKAEVTRLRQTILSMIPSDAGWILDTGCGSGWLTGALAGRDHHIISMDVNITNPQKVLQKYPSKNHFGLVADALALPIRKDGLDCIVAAEIIEHLADPSAFLRGLIAILKPGGILIVTTPYKEKIQYSLCIHCNQLTPHNAHLHSFNEASMRQLLPEGVEAGVYIFNSKLLSKLRILRLFSGIPIALWKWIDRIGIAVSGKKALRLMLTVRK